MEINVEDINIVSGKFITFLKELSYVKYRTGLNFENTLGRKFIGVLSSRFYLNFATRLVNFLCLVLVRKTTMTINTVPYERKEKVNFKRNFVIHSSII